jgi:hypothetical protein
MASCRITLAGATDADWLYESNWTLTVAEVPQLLLQLEVEATVKFRAKQETERFPEVPALIGAHNALPCAP